MLKDISKLYILVILVKGTIIGIIGNFEIFSFLRKNLMPSENTK